jgi:hypothetical protein
MTQVLEYILANYTWFLVGAVLVLLAIIGYYADKTNFGQGNKSPQNKDVLEKDEDDSIDISNIRLSEVTKTENKNEILNVPVDASNNNSNEITQNISIEDNSDFSNQKPIVKDNDDTVNNVDVQFNKVENIESSVQEIPILEESQNVISNENALQSNEEKFNMFSAEFDSLLPKKNIINTDLLSDIEDLEFDKTQKIDLSGVPDLDDIELPKIVGLSSDDEDIWKF